MHDFLNSFCMGLYIISEVFFVVAVVVLVIHVTVIMIEEYTR